MAARGAKRVARGPDRGDALFPAPTQYLCHQPLTQQAVSYPVGFAAQRAGLPGVHPHTLQHSCGYYLANKGHDLRLIQDHLGHRDPKHTVHYTRMAGRRFEGLWW